MNRVGLCKEILVESTAITIKASEAVGRCPANILNATRQLSKHYIISSALNVDKQSNIEISSQSFTLLPEDTSGLF